MQIHHRSTFRRATEALLAAGLQAHRHGHLAELPRERYPRLSRLMGRIWLPAVEGTLGDLVQGPMRRPMALQLLLEWALSQLRPDRPRRPGPD